MTTPQRSLMRDFSVISIGSDDSRAGEEILPVRRLPSSLQPSATTRTVVTTPSTMQSRTTLRTAVPAASSLRRGADKMDTVISVSSGSSNRSRESTQTLPTTPNFPTLTGRRGASTSSLPQRQPSDMQSVRSAGSGSLRSRDSSQTIALRPPLTPTIPFRSLSTTSSLASRGSRASERSGLRDAEFRASLDHMFDVTEHQPTTSLSPFPPDASERLHDFLIRERSASLSASSSCVPLNLSSSSSSSGVRTPPISSLQPPLISLRRPTQFPISREATVSSFARRYNLNISALDELDALDVNRDLDAEYEAYQREEQMRKDRERMELEVRLDQRLVDPEDYQPIFIPPRLLFMTDEEEEEGDDNDRMQI